MASPPVWARAWHGAVRSSTPGRWRSPRPRSRTTRSRLTTSAVGPVAEAAGARLWRGRRGGGRWGNPRRGGGRGDLQRGRNDNRASDVLGQRVTGGAGRKRWRGRKRRWRGMHRQRGDGGDAPRRAFCGASRRRAQRNAWRARRGRGGSRPDPELAERPQRRRFTEGYKLGILREAAAATRSGAGVAGGVAAVSGAGCACAGFSSGSGSSLRRKRRLRCRGSSRW
jgi:hypothetical protein